MEGYKYINDDERQATEKYEGIYTPEEIELNKKLYEECSKAVIDFALVEELLRLGADPLGGTAIGGWDLLNHVYEDIVCDSQANDSKDLAKITELFLKYGMDIDHPRIPYDGDFSINPLWSFAFITNENAICALKLLLEYGLSAENFAEFWDHSMSDFFHIDCGDPQNDEFWNYECTWSLKMLLLGASYDHILKGDEGLREFVCFEYNKYDIHNFRDWNRYEYKFDTSHCVRRPELYNSIVYIYDKYTGKEVWKIGIGKGGRQVLADGMC